MKAKSHAKKGKLGEAKELLKQVLSHYPKNKRVQTALAALVDQAHNQFPQSAPEQLINKLIELYNGGYLNAVVDEARVLTKQYPNEFVIWDLLGAAAAQTGQLELTVSVNQKLIALKSDHCIAYNNLGTALCELGNYEDAIITLNKAIQINPYDADAHYNLGNARHNNSEYKKAVESYEAAIEIRPDFIEAINNMGNTFVVLKNYEQAMQAFKNVLTLRPDFTQAKDGLKICFENLTTFE